VESGNECGRRRIGIEGKRVRRFFQFSSNGGKPTSDP
jgi:hypothetical protein